MTDRPRSALLQRLRERGVIRVVTSYALIAWLLLQIADVTFEPLGVPGWIMTALIVAAVLGLPVAVALAWFYEIGEHGVARDTASEGVARPAASGLRRYADAVIIGVLLIAVAVLLVRQSRLGTDGSAEATIAVLPFQNLSTAADGDVLASGIAEAVLHQLGSLPQIDVISRTSSFAFKDRAVDAREIGEQLGARYLLEGSVQSDRTRLQVTTQLIDAVRGAEIWSMRFVRRPGDIFAIQDEIAEQVTRALEISVDPEAIERMRGQGTENLDAYIAFLQGRALLATGRVGDTKEAVGHFERALKIDPQFASAYVSQAEAELFVAEYEVVPDRRQRFQRALLQADERVSKALEIDPDSGEALLQRAYLRAFDDLAAAEADYRRGLQLQPSSAKGHAGLATVLYETPERRDEALTMLDRARKLDPLEPAYDVAKAVFLLYHRADLAGAGELLGQVLERHPAYQPALQRLCELRGYNEGRLAEALIYCERALTLDPQSAAARRLLVPLYLELGETETARAIAGPDGREALILWMMIELYAGRWQEAGDRAQDALTRGVVSPDGRILALAALRIQARETGDVARAREIVEPLAGIDWGTAGAPVLTDRTPFRDAEIALVDLLLLEADDQHGRPLLAEILSRMHREVREQGRSEHWYRMAHPIALVLYGENDAALAMLERLVESGAGLGRRRYIAEFEPVYAPLRATPRFEALRRRMERMLEEQQQELQRLRREGLVPDRSTK